MHMNSDGVAWSPERSADDALRVRLHQPRLQARYQRAVALDVRAAAASKRSSSVVSTNVPSRSSHMGHQDQRRTRKSDALELQTGPSRVVVQGRCNDAKREGAWGGGRDELLVAVHPHFDL